MRIKLLSLALVASVLSVSTLQAAEGYAQAVTVKWIDVGRTGEHIVVYVDSPLAECSSGVFRLYRNEFGLTVDGQRFNLAQLQIAKVTNRPVAIYHAGGPYCWIANVILQ